MDDDGDAPAFVVRAVTVAPASSRVFHEAEWRDAIVLLARGEIVLESLSGTSHSFRRGAILWLTGLPLRALHNSGREQAVLVAVSRR
jgi:hypothetical protein